jgi:hypothetical protein
VSRYDEELAFTYADKAASGDVKPLVGRENELLSALRRAEQAFDEAWAAEMEERRFEDELRSKMKKKGGSAPVAYEKLAQQRRAAITTVEQMDETALRFLAWSAYTQGVVRPEPQPVTENGRRVVKRPASLAGGSDTPSEEPRTTLPLDTLGIQYRDQLERMLGAVEMIEYAGGGLWPKRGQQKGKSQPRERGSGEELGPLDAFVAELWDFWADATGTEPAIYSAKAELSDDDVKALRPVSASDSGIVPKSAALRLMYEAAYRLKDEHGDPLYLLSAVEGSMKRQRALRRLDE